ncbi:MAG: 12,18-didecarboxysiroheme deacetylase [Actinomycetota bacterium]|nr:12,18-didecarboxysiroheme deacetylase [Actinomycetota bacterium]
MIGISKLYMGAVEPSDALRYGRRSNCLPSHLLQFSIDKKPVIVWNCTKRCNLNCVHCYSRSTDEGGQGELTTAEAKAMIDNLADFGAPVLLFSGGEPLTRKDLPKLAAYAKVKGLRAVISTNGTLIDKEMAQVLKEIGLSYVGISIDGLREVHDNFRRKEGAFEAAIEGLRNCKEAGIKVGLRFTMNARNATEIDGVFDLMEKEDVPRICFYHLVYSGRGSELKEEDLSHNDTRAALDLIIERTKRMFAAGKNPEVLTVDNHADGPYLYLKLLKEDPERAAKALELLKMNEGNSTGIGIGCISWDGSVYPDQFWRNHLLGNVRERPFGQIWTDTSNPFLAGLKSRKPLIKGRCASCKWLNICNANFRARAEAVTGDTWESDPACYLTDEEIGL